MSCMNLISHHRGNFSSVECKGTTSTQRCSKKKGKKTYFDRLIIWYYHHHHYRHHLNVSVSQWYMKYSIAVLRLRVVFFFLTEERFNENVNDISPSTQQTPPPDNECKETFPFPHQEGKSFSFASNNNTEEEQAGARAISFGCDTTWRNGG